MVGVSATSNISMSFRRNPFAIWHSAQLEKDAFCMTCYLEGNIVESEEQNNSKF
jgi:hypothetical protein